MLAQVESVSQMQIGEVIHNSFPTNSQLGKNNLKPIANSQLVDTLLEQYTELIDRAYLKWFAKQFYLINPEMVHRAASEARNDGKDCRRLFAYLIGKYASRA